MTININPNRINIASGGGKTTERKRQDTEADVEVITPKRAYINHIPSPEALRSLISNAVAALRKGVYWDRGTILNLQV